MAYNVVMFKLINEGNMFYDITSQPGEIINQDNIGVQLNWFGNAVGTFDFQVSADMQIDNNGNVIYQGHWISLPLTTPIVATGSTGYAYVDFNQLSAQYIRVVYTKTSGTGVLDAYISAKGV